MYSKSTLLNLKQSLADRHNSGTLPVKSATLVLWTRLLNRGLDYCGRKLNLIGKTSLTTVGGIIALPTDFKSIFKVFIDNTELSQVGQDDLNKQTATVYWITGDHHNGLLLNTLNDDTYDVEYYLYPEPMIDDSDICIISDGEAVVAYAYAMLRKSESDPFEDADSSLQECDARLIEMSSDQMGNNANIDFSLEQGA